MRTGLVKSDVKDFHGFEPEVIYDAIDVINEEKMWFYLKDFVPKEGEGFMFTKDEKINDLMTKIDTRTPIHSASTLVMMMRIMHKLAKTYF